MVAATAFPPDPLSLHTGSLSPFDLPALVSSISSGRGGGEGDTLSDVILACLSTLGLLLTESVDSLDLDLLGLESCDTVRLSVLGGGLIGSQNVVFDGVLSNDDLTLVSGLNLAGAIKGLGLLGNTSRAEIAASASDGDMAALLRTFRREFFSPVIGEVGTVLLLLALPPTEPCLALLVLCFSFFSFLMGGGLSLTCSGEGIEYVLVFITDL